MSKQIIVKGKLSEPESLARKVVSSLKRCGFYRPDLMYRGCAVDEEGLRKVLEYGTDRNPEDEKSSRVERWGEYLENLALMPEEDFEELTEASEAMGLENSMAMLQYEFGNDNFSPRFIWALPEEGMPRCIEGYAIPSYDKDIPLVIAYRPEFLIRNIPLALHNPPTEIPATNIPLNELLNEGSARYKFKDGTTPKEAFVAVCKIVEE